MRVTEACHSRCQILELIKLGVINNVQCPNALKNGRSIWVAVAWLLCAAIILTGASFTYTFLQQEIESSRSVNVYQPARESLSSKNPQSNHSGHRNYQPNCNGPLNREDSDLCAQWGAVEAVAESNQLVRIGLWLSIVGILMTIVGTALLFRTLWQADKALAEAREANRISVESAETGARETAESLRHAREAIVADRAWICCEGANITRMDPSDLTLSVQLMWANSGRTPALKVGMAIAHCVIPAGQQSVPKLQANFNNVPKSAVLGLRGGITTVPFILTQQQATDFKSKKIHVVIYCQVRYFDVFSNVTDPSVEKVSEACYRLDYVRENNSNQQPTFGGGPVGPQNGVS